MLIPTAGNGRRAPAPSPSSLELGGDSLKRVPTWADAEHPFADDLKRKDYFGWARLSEKDVVAPGFVDEYARICRAAGPLMQFLCDALDVPY